MRANYEWEGKEIEVQVDEYKVENGQAKVKLDGGRFQTLYQDKRGFFVNRENTRVCMPSPINLRMGNDEYQKYLNLLRHAKKSSR